MKVIPIAQVAPSEWDRLCDDSLQAWLFHRSAWISIEAGYFVKENLSFALTDSDQLVAVHPLYLSDGRTGTSGEVLLHSGIHRHTGLALRYELGSTTVKASRSAAMQHIFEVAERLDADRVQLNTHNLAPENRSKSRNEIPFWIEDHGFFSGLNFGPFGMLPAPGMSTCNADRIIDLDAEENDLFNALDGACRRAVRKARSNALEFENANTRDCVDDYYAIAKISAVRTNETLPDARYYHSVWDTLGSTGRCALFFAKHAGKRIAGLWLFVDKRATSFLASASLPESLAMRVNDFLHWYAILWAKQKGMRAYRLGPTFPEVPQDWPIARVSKFKGKFGGASRTVIQGSFFRHPEKYLAAAQAHLAQLHLSAAKGKYDANCADDRP